MNVIWRERLKHYPGIAYLWPLLRAWQQERQIHNEQVYYEMKAKADAVSILNKEQVQQELQQRLAARGLKALAKPSGDLRIIYVSELTSWETYQIPPALAKFGQVITYSLSEHGFNPGDLDWLAQRHKFEEDLIAFVRAEHAKSRIDVMVAYLSGYHVAPETIRAVGDLGIVTCAFNWDDRLVFRGKIIGGRRIGPAPLAAAYDLNMTNATASLVKYFAEGGLAIFWPGAANPEHFKSLDRPFEYDVAFIGGCYGQRPALINYLRRQGFRLEVFGRGWPNGPLKEQEMIEVYARSRINLGISGVGYSMKETCLKGRDFEVPMCGALYLTSEQEDLHRVYEVDREVITYQNKEDCSEKIRYLLDHPKECERIRHEARQRSKKEHTWEQRFQELFIFIGALDGLF